MADILMGAGHYAARQLYHYRLSQSSFYEWDEKSPSAILSSASAIIFIFSGLIDWHSAVILGAATAVGGVIGGHYSTRIKNTAICVFL